MVNPSGESTMLGHWRIVLRRAEAAARSGRFEEAAALANQPGVADHYQLVRFRGRLGPDLIVRANRRAEANDPRGAIDDLAMAERLKAPPELLAEARSNLADRLAPEIRRDLERGEPARALASIDDLERRKIISPALRDLRSLAEAWRDAIAEALRGEFGRARELLDGADRLASGAVSKALTAARTDLEVRQNAATPKVEVLYKTLAQGDWARTLAAAEALLAIVPEHPAARRARTEAWRGIAAIGSAESSHWSPRSPSSGREAEPKSESLDESSRPLAEARAAGPNGRFLLWFDDVGGYLVCLDDRVVLGGVDAEGTADVPLMGDLASDHAAIIRERGGYRLAPRWPTFLNGRRVTEPAPLRHGDVIRLGQTVELEFQQPSPISASAKLAVVSRHRPPMGADGVLLMAETCIIGPGRQALVRTQSLGDPIVLYRQDGALWCRSREGFEVDDRPVASRAPLTLASNVRGEDFSFGLEAI